MSSPRLGLNLNTKAGDQFFGNESVARQLQIETMRGMKITDVKLLTDSDTQLKAAKWFVEQGFHVIVRFWKQPPTFEIPPTDLMKKFADVGVEAAEGYINEPCVELGRPPTTEVIDQLARSHIRFADQCAHAGFTPITPAIQGDRVYTWFEPFIARIVALGRKDALEGSIIGGHFRPANNLPDAAPPGFCVRSYELFDDVLIKHIGHSLRLRSTEWGYEPGDSDNKTLPPIDIPRHTAYNIQIAQMNYRPCLEVVYYWTWLPDWFNSGWWREDVAKSLPVVKAFIDMAKPVEPPVPPEPPKPPIQELSESEAIIQIRNWAWDHRFEGKGGYFADAAMQKFGPELGVPVTDEHEDWGWIWQAFAMGIKYCRFDRNTKSGDWSNIKVISWMSGPKLT